MNENQSDMKTYLSNEKYISSSRLKKKLFTHGLKKPCCECCKLTKWLDNPIPLELHHIDGNPYNNNLTNLQILCPNCHTNTSNYRGKNKKSYDISYEDIVQAIEGSETINQVLVKLGYPSNATNYKKVRKYLHQYNLYFKEQDKTKKVKNPTGWISDARKESWLKSRKVERPTKEELLDLVWSKSITSIAKEIGLSDNAIRKWATDYSIPVPPVGYWAKFNNGHLKECNSIKEELFEQYNLK